MVSAFWLNWSVMSSPSTFVDVTVPLDRHMSMQLGLEPSGEGLEGFGLDVVVRPQSSALGVDEAGFSQLLEVVAESRLADVEERHELADADRSGVLAQH